MSDQGLLPTSKVDQSQALLSKAIDKYQFIKNNNVNVLINKKDSPYYSETYQPGDTGSKESPRPSQLNINSAGIEIYRPDKFNEHDLAGEVLHIDPVANQFRDSLFKSLSPKQLESLKKESGDYGDSPGMSENDKLRNATDGLIRGYVIGQWPKDAVDRVLNDNQKAYLDKLKGYMQTGTLK